MTKREKVLSNAKSSEDRLLMSKIFDIANECEKKHRPAFSQFLNGYEITIAKYVINNLDTSFALYGGYDEAERMILAVFPDYIESDKIVYPINIIKITGREIHKLSHRDYLGSILALGIKREKIGDIIVFDDICYVLCMNDISDFIVSQIRKIGNVGVKLELCEINENIIPQKRHKDFDTIVSSLRIDSVISAMCHISRSKSADLIKNGSLAVNWQTVFNVSDNCNENDLFSVKGYGRFKIISLNGVTRSDRIKITIRQYI